MTENPGRPDGSGRNWWPANGPRDQSGPPPDRPSFQQPGSHPTPSQYGQGTSGQPGQYGQGSSGYPGQYPSGTSAQSGQPGDYAPYGQPGQYGQPAQSGQYVQPGQPGQYGPPGGYGPPHQPPSSGGSRRSRLPLVFGIIAAVLVLVVVGGALLFNAYRDRPAAGPAASPSTSASSRSQTPGTDPSDVFPTGADPTQSDPGESDPGGDDTVANDPTDGRGPRTGPSGRTGVTPEPGPTIGQRPSGITSGSGRIKRTSSFSPVVNLLILDSRATQVTRRGDDASVSLTYRGVGTQASRTVTVAAREGVRDASPLFPSNRSMYYYRDAVCYIQSQTSLECLFFRNAAAVRVTMTDDRDVVGLNYSYATAFADQFI